MTDSFRAMLEARVEEYRAWSRSRSLSSCRWVEYIGVEMVGAVDVPLDDVERCLENAICEGFRVAWADQRGRLYVRVWEDREPEPTWDKVFAEESLADV